MSAKKLYTHTHTSKYTVSWIVILEYLWYGGIFAKQQDMNILEIIMYAERKLFEYMNILLPYHQGWIPA